MRQQVGSRPLVVLSGARQSGKTSLLRHCFPQHHYVSLDLPRLAELAEQEGERFLAEHPPPSIIDEVQYAPRLLRYVKHAVDHQRQRTGQYLITGSQKFALMRGVSESLAGRAAVLELQSLSLGELEAGLGREAIEVDFVLPQGEALILIECKWAAPSRPPRGLTHLEALLGPELCRGSFVMTGEARARRHPSSYQIDTPLELRYMQQSNPNR